MVPALQFPLKQIVVQLRMASLAALVLAPVVGSLSYSATALATDDHKSIEEEFKNERPVDWVPLEELTEAQKKRVPNACCGAYIPPERTDSDVGLDPKKASFRGSADESEAEAESRLLLKGKVAITQGNRSISTENAVIDKEKNQADMTGGVQLRDPNIMVHADSATMNLDTGEAVFQNTRFVLYETRIHGVSESLHKFGDNVIDMEQSEISSCEPGDNSWSIRGSEISLHPDENYGTARNMRVNIKDIPVIYMPYVRFPIGNERLTGFLFPTMTHSSRNGWDTVVPFYWNIAPDMDATITPRYLSQRGPMLEAEVRHKAEHFDTELNGSLINNDHGGYSSYLEKQIALGEITEEEAYPYRGHNRWYAKLEQQGGKGEAWSTNIDYSDMSDRDYLRDMYSGSVDSNRQAYIRQTLSADYRTDNWFMGVKTDEYRLLTKSQLRYRELPRVHLDGNYQFDDWVLKLNNEYVNFVQNRYLAASFDTQAELDSALANTIYGQRMNTDYSLTWNKSVPWGFLKPSVGVKGLGYQLEDNNLNSNANAAPSFVVPQASLDSGLYFERDSSLFGETYVQTLEPRAFYFYSKYKDQGSLYGLMPNPANYVNFDTGELTFNYNQLFRTSRFAGGDRIDDANQISLAVSSAFVSQATGIERLRVSVGQIFYANDRRITVYDSSTLKSDENTRPTSDIAAQVSGQVGQKLHLSTDVAYDQRTTQLDNANFSIHYLDEQNRIFNLSYRYTLKPYVTNPSQPELNAEQSLNQIDASVFWPVTNSLSIVARNNHDFTHGVELDTFAGFEYNDCCYRARIVARRWLRIDYGVTNFLATVTNHDYEPGIMLELELKGFGSLDQRVSGLLSKTIPGFSDREKNLR